MGTGCLLLLGLFCGLGGHRKLYLGLAGIDSGSTGYPKFLFEVSFNYFGCINSDSFGQPELTITATFTSIFEFPVCKQGREHDNY